MELYLHCAMVLYTQEDLPFTGVRFFFYLRGGLTRCYMTLPPPTCYGSCPFVFLLGLEEGESGQSYKYSFRLHTYCMRQVAEHAGIKYGQADMHLSFDLWNILYFPATLTTLRFAMKDLV